MRDPHSATPRRSRAGVALAACVPAFFALAFFAFQTARAQEIRIMQAVFYDHVLDGPNNSQDFGNYRSGACGADNNDRYTFDMVQRTLKIDTLSGAFIWKRPQKNRDLVMHCNSKELDKWFDIDFTRDKKRHCRKLYFIKKGTTTGGSPIWTFEDARFFPLDDLGDLCDNACLKNLYGDRQQSPDGKPHNYNWTMTINATFTYRGGETFYFKGDDDLWVFINNRLALDLGGIHSPRLEGEVRIDEVAAKLMLVKGQTYPVDIFFAERKGAGSWVKIETTMDLIPINLQGIEIVDKSGKKLTGSLEIDRTTSFCVHPTWDKPGESWCRNYNPPQLTGGSVAVNWTLNGQPIGTATAECIEVDPSLPAFGNGATAVLRAVHPEGYSAEITLAGKPDVRADSVLLIGNGRLETIAVVFNGNPGSLPAVWSVSFDGQGFSGRVSQADRPSRQSGTTLYFDLPAGARGPLGQSYLRAGDLTSSFVKTEATGEVRGIVPVIDRMSPVILSAVLETNIAGNTLILTVSEQLAGVGQLFESHVVFSRPGGADFRMNLGTWSSNLDKNKTGYTLIWPAGAAPAATLLDSVTLEPGNAFVKDLNGNLPRAFRVEITGEITVTPTALRLRGRGRLDTVIVELDQPAALLPAGYAVRFTFAGAERTFNASNNPIAAGNRLIYVFPSGATPIGQTYAPAGTTGSLHHPYRDKAAATLTAPVHDEIGAVVDETAKPVFSPVAAGATAHTLTVRLSEEVAVNRDLTIADFLFLRGGTGTAFTIPAANVTVTRNGRDITFGFALTANVLPQPGDSLSLASTALDHAGNVPPRYPVAIGGRAITPNRPLRAAYFDRTANGTIDKAVLVFEHELVALPRDIVLKNAGTVHVVDPASDSVLFDGTARTRVIILLGERNRMPGLTTAAIDAEAAVGAQAFQGLTDNLTIAVNDSSAPVIQSATWHPGPDPVASGGRIDTLLVMFSEPVSLVNGPNATADRPFTVINAGRSLRFTMHHVRGDGTNTLMFAVTELDGDIPYPSPGDSIFIAVDDRIADRGGVIQRAPYNRRAALSVVFPPLIITVSAGNNPLARSSDRIPAQFMSRLQPNSPSRGTVIMVEPSRVPVSIQDFTVEGTIAIYDAVGSIVRARAPMMRGRNAADPNLYFVWEGTNERGRKVGSGSYLAIVNISDNINKSAVRKITLGVGR